MVAVLRLVPFVQTSEEEPAATAAAEDEEEEEGVVSNTFLHVDARFFFRMIHNV